VGVTLHGMSASHAARVAQQKVERDARAAKRKWDEVDRKEEATPAPAPAPAPDPDPDDLATYHPDPGEHQCGDFCKRHCPFGGNGPPNFCPVCDLHSINGRDDCQRCACLAKPFGPFKGRLGGTCAAYLDPDGRKCDC
jgi:hypothetical protein